MSQLRVVGLNIYPVKSCRPVRPQAARVERRGLENDRRWMVVDDRNQFITRRNRPEMAKISVGLSEDHMILSKDGLPTLQIPRAAGGEAVRVKIWKSRVAGKAVSSEADEWLSKALGVHSRLVYMPESARRRMNPKFNAGQDLVGFADAYPILIASQASVEDLNSRLESPLTMDRFRPNIVLGGCAAYEEDSWQRIRMGDVVLRATRPCARCLVTTQHPETGESLGQEPLRTLGTYRKYSGGGVIFGMYYAPESFGTIRVGQEVAAEGTA